MSIIDKIYVLLGMDTSGLKKGAEEIDKAADKTKKSFSETEKAVNRVGDSFVGLAKKFAGYATAAVSVGAIIFSLKSAAEYSIALGTLSRQLGVNVEDLDAWGKAVRENGGSVEQFDQSLKSLGEHLGGSAAITLKVLPQLADVFERLGRYRAMMYGKMLGLDENTILLLQKGRREVEETIKRQKELGVLTKRDTEISQKFNAELNNTKTAFQAVYFELLANILPAFTKLTEIIIPALEYLRQHINLIKGAAIGVGVVAAAFLAPFIAANAAIIALITGITTLIGLFAIAYEDIKAFMKGNDSLTGDLLKKWPLVGQAIKNVIELIKILSTGFVDFVKFLTGFGDKKLTMDIQTGQNVLDAASSNYFNSQSSNSITSQSYSRNTSINTGEITIHTKATDATGIAKNLGQSLESHLRYANSFFDDGIRS